MTYIYSYIPKSEAEKITVLNKLAQIKGVSCARLDENEKSCRLIVEANENVQTLKDIKEIISEHATNAKPESMENHEEHHEHCHNPNQHHDEHEHGCCCEHGHEHNHNHEKKNEHSSAWDFQYHLAGLDCPNCTAKIDEQVSKLSQVENSHLDYITKILRIKTNCSENEIFAAVEKIVHGLEPDVEIEPIENKSKAVTSAWNFQYRLAGLDCPNCTAKIDKQVSKLSQVENSHLDYITKILRIKTNCSENEIFAAVEKIVHSLEPDVEIKKLESKAENPKSVQTQVSEKSVFESYKKEILSIGLAVLLFIVSFAFSGIPLVSAVLAIAAYLIAGWKVVVSAARNIIKGRAMDETFLMTVATVGAFCLKDFDEGAAVMIFFQVGELFQTIAVERSRRSITKLLEIAPETVSLKAGGEIKTVSPKDVKVGQTIVVSPGERIGLDGIVSSGQSEVDNSALTGEFIPVEVSKGKEVLSGAVNGSGVFEMTVSKEYSDSTAARILESVQTAASQKAVTEKFITRFARVYTPIVVFSALALALIPPIFAGDFAKWLYRGLMFLVISCPCALVISVPLSFFAGIGGAAKNGVLIKGAKDLENLSKCKTAAFDKTGTLTKGKFAVKEIISSSEKEDYILKIAAAAESLSTHPLGRSICEEYKQRNKKSNVKAEVSAAENIKEIAGGGIECEIGGEKVLCGKSSLLSNNGVSFEEVSCSGSAVYAAKGGKYLGAIVLNDTLKENSKAAVEQLNSMGISTVLLTGDNSKQAQAVANELGISQVRSELLPQDKADILEELINKEKTSGSDGKVMFTGDGINDAPVIARADVGLAMGGAGSDAAIEAADAVLMTDDPMCIVSAVKTAKKTMKIVRQNIVGAIGIKVLILILGALGLAGMWLAIFADVGVAVLAILNALRSRNA